MISTPDQTVNENAGPAVVCVELENPIEMPFQLDFVTGSSAPNGIPAATGKCMCNVIHTRSFQSAFSIFSDSFTTIFPYSDR